MSIFLSLDPGVTNLGIAVIDTTDGITVLETQCVTYKKSENKNDTEREIKYGGRTVKIENIIRAVNKFLDKYETVELIVSEAPFYNSLSPVAFGSLLEVIFALKYTVIIPNEFDFKMVEPRLVKKVFADHGNAKKDDMKRCLIEKIASGEIVLNVDVETLSEHEIDAIAVAHTHITLTKAPEEK